MKPAERLVQAITQRMDPVDDDRATSVKLFFCLDEIINLIDEDDDQVYYAIRRVMRIIAHIPVWMFLLSTNSPLRHLLPPARLNRSDRIASGALERIAPFYAFPMDLEVTRVLSREFQNEANKPLAHYATAHHLTMFGRPLWRAYRDYSCRDLRQFVTQKLLRSRSYDTTDPQHVAAVLAARICLGRVINSRDAITFQEVAVSSHLRLVQEMDSQNGLLRTIVPPEPIISEAVAHLLTSTGSWPQSIECLATKLLRPGIIDKGRSGELVTRLLLIMAHDKCAEELMRLKGAHVPTFDFAKPLSLLDFLRNLFTTSIYDSIVTAPVGRFGTTVGEVFRGALLNFTHFVETEQFLDPGDLQELIHNLLFSGAALQLSPTQPLWDILIPLYCGQQDEQFDTTKVSALLIQVKNRKQKSNLWLTPKDYEPFFAASLWTQHVLVLLLDTGVTPTKVTQRVSYTDQIIGFQVVGMGSEAYACVQATKVDRGDYMLEMDIAFKMLLETVDSADDDIQQVIARYNLRYETHTWKERFGLPALEGKTCGGYIESSKTRGGVGGVRMEGGREGADDLEKRGNKRRQVEIKSSPAKRGRQNDE